MKFHDMIVGIVLVVFGAWVIVEAQAFPAMPGQRIGPSTFPTLLGSLCCICGFLLAAQSRRAVPGPLAEIHPGWRVPSRLACVGIAVLGTGLLALGFERVGFPIGGTLLLSALYFAAGLRRPHWLAISALFVFTVHLVMARLLYVPLPAGLLRGLL